MIRGQVDRTFFPKENAEIKHLTGVLEYILEAISEDIRFWNNIFCYLFCKGI